MKRPLDKPTPRPLGSIHRDEALPLAEFGRRMNLGNEALADAQRAGLRTILFGRVKYVLGDDALRWFQQLAERQGGGNE
jgi:hypothetical protein